MASRLSIRVPAPTTCIAASLRRAELCAQPFPNWRLRGVLPEDVVRALAGLDVPPARSTGRSGRRELHNETRRYLAGAMLADHPVAAQIAEAFQSARVAAVLMALTGAVLVGTYLRIEYAVDLDGFWLEPHTDLGVKALTFFLQLGVPGQEGLGTDLYVAPDRWAERIPFGWNTALVFVPSDRSWHGFEPRPIVGARRSLIVNYVTDAWRAREQLAFPDRPIGRSADREYLGDHRGVGDHVRGDGVVADGVHPGVAGAKRHIGLEHAGAEVGQDDEDQREGGVAGRAED